MCYALACLGIIVENKNDLLPFIGPPLTYSFKEYYHLNNEQMTLAVAKYRERYAEKGIYENELYPDIDYLLQQLTNHGYTLYIATSKPQMFAELILEYWGQLASQLFPSLTGKRMFSSGVWIQTRTFSLLFG